MSQHWPGLTNRGRRGRISTVSHRGPTLLPVPRRFADDSRKVCGHRDLASKRGVPAAAEAVPPALLSSVGLICGRRQGARAFGAFSAPQAQSLCRSDGKNTSTLPSLVDGKVDVGSLNSVLCYCPSREAFLSNASSSSLNAAFART